MVFTLQYAVYEGYDYKINFVYYFSILIATRINKNVYSTLINNNPFKIIDNQLTFIKMSSEIDLYFLCAFHFKFIFTINSLKRYKMHSRSQNIHTKCTSQLKVNITYLVFLESLSTSKLVSGSGVLVSVSPSRG